MHIKYTINILFIIFFLGITSYGFSKTITVQDTMIRPEVLFHGSSVQGINKIKPRNKSKRRKDDPPQIFASPHLSVASMFILNVTDDWGGSGKFCSNCPFYFYCKDKKKYEMLDQGGSIYVVPSENFQSDLGQGLGINEWTSRSDASVMYEFKFNKALDSMLAFGVQVYFVNQYQFNAIKKSKDHGFEILSSLQSENIRRGINPRKLK